MDEEENVTAWVDEDEESEYARFVSEEELDRYQPPASISPRDLIDLAPTLRIHKRDLAGKAILICGIRRHGKTTLGARLAEQLGRHYLPLFIPDAEGDYLSLVEVLPRAVLAGYSEAASLSRSEQFVALDTAQAAFQFGYDLLALGYQVILDLSSYPELDQGIAMQVNIIRGMFHWTNTHPHERVTAQVYLDEAQRYLPQTLSESVIQNRGLLLALLKCHMDLIANGGKRGLSPVILTQRLAQVNNKIMAQTEVFFLLRQTHDSDLDRCMEFVNREVATKAEIARFAPGQGVYIACDGRQIVTQFSLRKSSGERSETPQADTAYRYARLPMQRPGALRQPSYPAPMQPEATAEEGTPATPIPTRLTVLPVPPEHKPQPSLTDAIECWNELVSSGQNPSRNNLQAALLAKGFECKENWARKFYEDIKAMLNTQQQDESSDA